MKDPRKTWNILHDREVSGGQSLEVCVFSVALGQGAFTTGKSENDVCPQASFVYMDTQSSLEPQM